MLSFYTHSTKNLSPFDDFEKKSGFSKKKLFFQKKNSLAFEKSHFFISVLRQIYYNLVMENFKIHYRTI